MGALGLVLDWGGGTATGLSPYHGPFIPDVRSCRDFRRPNLNCSRLDSDSLASLLRLIFVCTIWAWGPEALAIRVGLTSLAISQLGVILVRE